MFLFVKPLVLLAFLCFCWFFFVFIGFLKTQSVIIPKDSRVKHDNRKTNSRLQKIIFRQ